MSNYGHLLESSSQILEYLGSKQVVTNLQVYSTVIFITTFKNFKEGAVFTTLYFLGHLRLGPKSWSVCL
jgi:hypothetical protein